jgi:acetoin utilization protein AcuB
MRIRELMSRDVLTIDRSNTCYDAVTRMCRAKVRHLPVVAGEGTVVGIVTDRDLRHHLFNPSVYGRIGSVPVQTLLKDTPVAAVMSSPALSVAPSAEVMEAARVMRDSKVGSLVVVEDERVVGIVTEIDLLRQIVQAEAPLGPELDIVISYP